MNPVQAARAALVALVTVTGLLLGPVVTAVTTAAPGSAPNSQDSS